MAHTAIPEFRTPSALADLMRETAGVVEVPQDGFGGLRSPDAH
jgi:hypothetical protein